MPWEEGDTFTVHFHGTFIPLQGIKYIIEAADILGDEDIHFRIIGSGQEFEMIKKLVTEKRLESKIEFTGKVPIEKLPGFMASAQIVLGIFGDTEKTKHVIPNKVYEAMAMGKCIITADTPAIHELDGSTAALFLVPVADSKALANAILTLRRDANKRRELELTSRDIYERELLPQIMVKKLLPSLL
jgi:glycosyltransferase involved in cell wall biosynthesis